MQLAEENKRQQDERYRKFLESRGVSVLNAAELAKAVELMSTGTTITK